MPAPAPAVRSESPDLVTLGIPPAQRRQRELHVGVPEHVDRALQVAARQPPGEGDVGEPAGVTLVLDA